MAQQPSLDMSFAVLTVDRIAKEALVIPSSATSQHERDKRQGERSEKLRAQLLNIQLASKQSINRVSSLRDSNASALRRRLKMGAVHKKQSGDRLVNELDAIFFSLKKEVFLFNPNFQKNAPVNMIV
jgi:hypothetical protein